MGVTPAPRKPPDEPSVIGERLSQQFLAPDVRALFYDDLMRLGLGLHVKAVKAWERMSRWKRQRAREMLRRSRVERVHIGCGQYLLADWFNVDILDLPGVDLVHDVRSGLPFKDVRFLYAEHFIEHLTFDDGLRFMKECRAALAADGILRLSTPNLDWVVDRAYNRNAWNNSSDALRSCFELNKAFRGWSHQFLYNQATLGSALRSAGFAEVEFLRYGESTHAELANLERHETYPDSPDLPHVVIAEARGIARSSLREIEPLLDDYDKAVRST